MSKEKRVKSKEQRINGKSKKVKNKMSKSFQKKRGKTNFLKSKGQRAKNNG